MKQPRVFFGGQSGEVNEGKESVSRRGKVAVPSFPQPPKQVEKEFQRGVVGVLGAGGSERKDAEIVSDNI